MSTISNITLTRDEFLQKFNQTVEPKNKTGCSADTSDRLSDAWYRECFRHYDKDMDGFLNKTEFEQIILDIFNSPSSTTDLSRCSAEILSLLDEDNDARLGFKETRWKTWLNSILKPVSALIIVDVQNDFIDGSLALKKCPAGQDGTLVVPVINQLLSTVHFEVEIYSLDWHDEEHVSFIDNIHLRKLHHSSPVSAENAKVCDTVVFSDHAPHTQVLWPKHCVQGTWGAEFHADLKVGSTNSVIVHKGTNTNVDSYSAFFDNQRISQTNLESVLRARNVTDVYVCGLAYDVCVRYTALDALELGFRTYLIDDASKGVSLENIDQTKTMIAEKGARIVSSGQIKELVHSKVCNIDLALWSAKHLVYG